MQQRRPLPDWYTKKYFVSYNVIAVIGALLVGVPLLINTLGEIIIGLIQTPKYLTLGATFIGQVSMKEELGVNVVSVVFGAFFIIAPILSVACVVYWFKMLIFD